MLHPKCIKHCAITIFIGLIGSVNSLPNSRKIEPVDKSHRVRPVVAVVFDIVDTETWSVGGQVVCSCCPSCATAVAEAD